MSRLEIKHFRLLIYLLVFYLHQFIFFQLLSAFPVIRTVFLYFSPELLRIKKQDGEAAAQKEI